MSKQEIAALLEEFPDDVDIREFQRRLALLARIDEGERDIAEGRILTHEQAVARLAPWLQSSGQNEP